MQSRAECMVRHSASSGHGWSSRRLWCWGSYISNCRSACLLWRCIAGELPAETHASGHMSQEQRYTCAGGALDTGQILAETCEQSCDLVAIQGAAGLECGHIILAGIQQIILRKLCMLPGSTDLKMVSGLCRPVEIGLKVSRRLSCCPEQRALGSPVPLQTPTW